MTRRTDTTRERSGRADAFDGESSDCGTTRDGETGRRDATTTRPADSDGYLRNGTVPTSIQTSAHGLPTQVGGRQGDHDVR